jgi:hypothetical protein
LQRQTLGGGTLIGDTLTDLNRETYVAAEGFSGEYQVTIRRIWGKPLGGKAKLVIITHQGTPDENREEKVVRFDRSHTLKVTLNKGRRKSTAAVPPPAAYQRPEEKGSGVKTSSVLVKLRDMADPEFTGGSGGVGSYGGVAKVGAKPLQTTKETDAYQGKVSPFFPNNIDLAVQALVSADRRYVRLSVNPVFQTVTNFGGGRLVNIPLIPGFNP